MNTYAITIITHTEKDSEGKHFKTLMIEADAYMEDGSQVNFYAGNDMVAVIPKNGCIIKKLKP